MGRKLIEIKKIEDKIAKEYAFAQRKRGLIKKTIELGVLCDQEMFLIIYDKDKNAMIEYSTENFTEESVKKLRSTKLSQHQKFVSDDLEALQRKNITIMQFQRMTLAKNTKVEAAASSS